ncbi:MAG: biotin transporter BioY [Acidimicrobiia bacterium]
MVQITVPSPVITAAVLPRSKVVSIALVIGFALLTAGAAQLVIPLPYTPVPITGQTFVVLLAGVALGSNLGAASMALYVALGAIGLPFYAEGSSGIEVVRGATGGYLVGFVVAAWVMGRLAERRQDRAMATAIPLFLLGSVTIHLFGVPWLAHTLGVSGTEAIELGSVPFIVGDLVKVVVAGTVLPATWRLVRTLRNP